MEHKAVQWHKKEAINFFDRFFRLPQELQEKIWRMVANYRSSIGLCIGKHPTISLPGTHVLPVPESLIVGPNKNNVVVSPGALHVKKNHTWVTQKLPCTDCVYCMDQDENRWIQAANNQLKIFDYDGCKTIAQLGAITLNKPLAMALFVAKNKILSFSDDGLEEHVLLTNGVVSSKPLIKRELFDAQIGKKSGYGKVHLVKDMGYCKSRHITRLSCYTSNGFKTFLVDLNRNRLFSIHNGWVTFFNEDSRTAYLPSSIEQPAYSLSFQTIAESLVDVKKSFEEYKHTCS
jgi:hypothetical protein